MIKSFTIVLAGVLSASVYAGESPDAPLKGESPLQPQEAGAEALAPPSAPEAWTEILPFKTFSATEVPAESLAPVSGKAPGYSPSAPMKTPAADLGVNGLMIANSTWKNTYAMGFYRVPVAPGGEFTLIGRTQYKALTAGYVSGTRYIGTELNAARTQAYICAFDMDTWKLSRVATPLNRAMVQACEDPATGTVYAITLDESGEGYEWAVIDLESGYRRTVASIPYLAYLACDWNGQYYYMTSTGEFGKLDKATAQLTKIADTGLTASYAGGACVNNDNATMLVSLYPEQGAFLYEIDLATGTATKVLDFPDNAEITNMYIPDPPAGAYPAKPELNISAPEGTMTVGYSFDMPSKLADGSDASGLMNWTIYGNGFLIAEGSAQAGSHVAGTYTAQEPGYVKYSTIVSNDKGHSQPDIWFAYIGKGAPDKPGSPKLEVADGKFTISWNPPSGSGDGGYINPEELTYTIVDQDGNTVSDNAVSPYVMDMPQTDRYTVYKYEIYTVNDYRRSQPAVTNGFGTGEFCAPMQFEFRTNKNIDGFTVIDCNEDEWTWMEWNGNACYKYSKAGLPADDWLISPGIRLEANTTYIFTCSAKTQGSSDHERIEVKAGRGTTVADMTMSVIPETELTVSQYVTLQGLLTTTEAGYYNVGFHAVSEPNKWFLSVEGFTFNEGTSNVAPKSITGTRFTADPDGSFSTEIEWDVPSEFLDGSAIPGSVDTEIYREGELIATVAGTPGSKASYTDQVETEGTYTYSLFPVYKGAKGIGMVYQTFVGRKAPAAPSNVKMRETAPGHVVISWDAVTTDLDGDPVNPDHITYTITRRNAEGEWEPVFTSLSETSKEFTAVEEGQRFEVYAVSALNIDRTGEAATTPFMALGTSYTLPVEISGRADLDRFILGFNTGGGLEWRIVDDSQFATVKSQDHDNSFFAAANPTSNPGLYGTMFTGKIDLAGVANPTLSFYTFIIANPSVADENTVTARVIDAQGNTHSLKVADHADLQEYAGTWYKCFVDLSQFRDQEVQVELMATSVSMIFTDIDNIRVYDALDHDLELTDLTAPSSVEFGEHYTVDLIVTNEGRRDASGFDVTVSCNGEDIHTYRSQSLRSGERAQYILDRTYARTDDPERRYTARISYADDQNPDNDISGEVTVERKLNGYPRVEGVIGDIVDEGVSLTWEAAPSVAADVVTEDFEGAESFGQEVDGWTMVDVDDKPICGITRDYSIPGTVMGSTHASFIVYDNTDETDWKELFASHSGNKFLVSAGLYYGTDGASDDWAISPILSGEEQTVTFQARCFDTTWADYIEVYACQSLSTDPADGFVKVMDTTRLKKEWTRYKVNLPEGTNYFAIRSTSDKGFLAMIDDVTYRAAGLELEGYNIYHDGVRLNDAPVADARYLHAFAHDDATHTYHVTAVYRHGARPGMESEVSDKVEITTSGIGSVASATWRIRVTERVIHVEGTEGETVSITAADGRVVARSRGDIHCSAEPGIYMVRVGSRTEKIIVK